MFYLQKYIDLIQFGLLGFFIVSAAIQLYYYLFIYFRLPAYKRAPQLRKYSISVVICARNEAENLRQNLTSVLEQKHEDFEVVVVNDCSTDETDSVLGEYIKKYKNLRVTSIAPDPKFSHGKKLAITVGIKAAKHEWLVFTDADCRAESDQWLNRMQENFTDQTDLVLGYGGYLRRKGLLNSYLRYDTVMIAIQYLSYALAGKPYMGVGRNMAYRKSLFFRNKGFASHYGLSSGDDDLFVNETAGKSNTAVEFHHESHTRSVPKTTWRDWFRQKKRHYTTSRRYKSADVFMLGFEIWSRIMFYATFSFLIAMQLFIPYVLSIFAIRLILQLILFKLSLNRLNEKNIWLWGVIFDLFSIFINFNILLASTFTRKKSRWK